jgi:hypothetical protein
MIEDKRKEAIDRLQDIIRGSDPLSDTELIEIARSALTDVVTSIAIDVKAKGGTPHGFKLQTLNVLSHWIWRHEEMQKTRRLNIGEFKFVFSGVPNQHQLDTENDAEVKAEA